MRIAIINLYQQTTNRGAEIFVRKLRDNLNKHHDIDIYSSPRIFPDRLPIVWRLYLDPQGLLIAYETLKHFKRLVFGNYDIIIPTNGGWQALVVRIVALFSRSKVVISGQSGPGWDDRINLFTFPDIFVSLSRHSVDWARKRNPFVKCIVIPNGVDLDVFKPAKKNVFKDLEKPIILTVGALTPSKRHQLTIKAVSKLKKGSLVIVGKGREEATLKKLAQSLIPGRYKIASYTHSKMPDIYQSADLFVFPTSPHESFGIVLLEAMASGLAVVCTDDPIRKEIVGGAGVFVNPNHTQSYSRAINNALDAKWNNLPRNQAKKYSWNLIAKKYDDLFNQLTKYD